MSRPSQVSQKPHRSHNSHAAKRGHAAVQKHGSSPTHESQTGAKGGGTRKYQDAAMKKEWQSKHLGDLCEVFSDGDWVESKDQSPDGIRLMQTGNVGEGVFKDRAEKARYISEATFKRLRCTEIFEGDCLISRLPDPVERSCILPETGERMITDVDCAIVRFRPDKRKFTSASTDSRRNYWIKNGDFLITRSNTRELVGHVAIASGITEPTIYPDIIMRMNPAPDRMMTEFLYYQMRSPSLRKEIMGRAQGANPTMKKISNSAVKTLPVAVPPIPAQRAIIETLNALTEETQRLAAIYKRKLAALEALKKSLLHQAFIGEL